MNYKLKLKLTLIVVLILLGIPCSKIFAFTYSTTPTTSFSFEVLLQKELEGSIKLPSAGNMFYVISDADENFYLPTNYGFNKYDSSGELVYKVENEGPEYQEVTNLLLVDDKIVYLANRSPGYINVFDSNTGEQLAHVRVYEGTFSARYPFYGINNAGNFVFFSSGIPPLIYRFNVNDYSIDNYSFKEGYGVNSLYSYTAPLNIDGNKVLFTSTKGILQLFDAQNIATPVFFKAFNKDYSYLYSQVSASIVPTTYNQDFIFTKYADYVCSYEKSGGINNNCLNFVDYDNGLTGTNENIVATSNSLYLIAQQIVNSVKSYFLLGYSSDLNKQIFVDLGSGADKGGLGKDLQENIISTGGSIVSISGESGEVLGTFDITDSENNVGVKHASLISPTSSGNFYVLAIKYDNDKKREFSQIYKFKGIGASPDCELGFYCDSTPKFRPVILIHGLGGSYQDWFDSKNAVVRQAILQKYQAEDSEFPDDWVYSYSYGYTFGGDYNYQGKIEDISTNLHFDVDRLSAQHKLAGGDGKVDIVAYSLGGLIARHYLLEKTGFPGEQNLNVDHKVGKLILVASPVNGSSGFQIIDDLEKEYPFVGEPIKTKVNQVMTFVQGHPIDLREDIGLQIGSESSYLKLAREDNLPDNIEYYRSYANFMFDYNYNLFGVELGNQINFGDFIVFPEDTFLYGADFTDSKLVEKTSKADLVYSGGTLKLKSDLGDLPTIYHNAFIYNEDNVNNILNFLSHE